MGNNIFRVSYLLLAFLALGFSNASYAWCCCANSVAVEPSLRVKVNNPHSKCFTVEGYNGEEVVLNEVLYAKEFSVNSIIHRTALCQSSKVNFINQFKVTCRAYNVEVTANVDGSPKTVTITIDEKGKIEIEN